MSTLLDLTLRGSLAAIAVIVLDRSLAGRISGTSRRLWWCLVPLAFLVPLDIPRVPALGRLPQPVDVSSRVFLEFPAAISVAQTQSLGNASLGMDIWVLGAIAYIALVATQTMRASRRWSHDRLSTDHALLDLLENCKTETGVTAPIGLVVSDRIESPAILGWLRPRILLPAPLVATASAAVLRPILLHELAHFRWYDIPFNWLLTLVRAAHWFNPIAHIGARAWTQFREEAADEAAVRWMREDSGKEYGDALVSSLRKCRGGAVPFGALGIIESIDHLRRRIRMIGRFRRKSPRIMVVGIASILLTGAVCSISADAADKAPPDPKAVVTASVEAWLKEIDAEQYDQSWRDTSAYFRGQVSMKEWEGDLKGLRAMLGKIYGRKRVSMAFQKLPDSGPTPNAETVVVQFDSSYENQKYSFETAYFMKEADGHWRATGYFVHPR